MTIIIGRGKNRQSYELPCGDIVKRGSINDQMQMHGLICRLLGIA